MSRVVVVGGGVIGLSIAWRLAVAGDVVTVCDPAPGQGTSWVAAGMLAPVAEARLTEPALLDANRAAAARWPAFADELAAAANRPVDLHTTGSVLVALDDDDRRAVEDLGERLEVLGQAVDWLRGRTLRRHVPALTPGIRGGLVLPDDQAVDNRQVVTALLAAAPAAGVTIDDVTVRAVTGDRDGITGVDTSHGRLEADIVVVAAGCDSAHLELPAGVAPPVRPVKGQIVRLQDDPAHPLLDRVVRGWAHGWPTYLVPRASGEVVVGATMEDVGFDTDVTVGGLLDVLRPAVDLVPGLKELPVVEHRAGLRPSTPDNAALVGETGVPGLLLATGHHRHGILQAPVTADAIVALVHDRLVPEAMKPLAPERQEHACASR